MVKYEKPIAHIDENYTEGIYLASGDITTDGGSNTSGTQSAACNSKYYNGVFHAPDYNRSDSYSARFGCNGCPAFRWNGCGLQLEQYWGSYDADNGNRFPNWERIGHAADDAINWSDVGSC